MTRGAALFLVVRMRFSLNTRSMFRLPFVSLRRLLPSLAALLACGSFAVGARAEQVYVELILDASGSMWTKLEDGRPRITAAKQVLADFIARTPAAADLNVGLRIYGSEIRAGQPGACDDSKLFVPLRGFDRDALLKTVRDARVIGATPIAKSLDLAAQDLAVLPAQARKSVLLVTDGEESCGGNVAAAIARLKASGANLDFRIVGIGLSTAATKRFAALAPIENANSAAALAAAVARAVQPALPPAAKPAATAVGVRVTLVRDSKPVVVAGASVTFSTARSEKPTPLTAGANGVFTGQFLPGGYTPAVTLPGRASARQFPLVSVRADARNEFVLDITEPPQVRLTAQPASVLSGDPIQVDFEGAGAASRGWIVLAPVGSSDETELDYRAAEGPAGVVELRAPDAEAKLEARYITTGEQRTVAGRSSPISVTPAKASVRVARTAGTGASVKVEWNGPESDDNFLTFAPVGAEAAMYLQGSWARASAGSPLTLTAPLEPGEYEVRYVMSGTDRVAASARIKVSAAKITFSAPDEVMVGDTVPVRYTLAGGSSALVIVPPGADAGDYGDFWGRPQEDGQSTLTAPLAPGPYEIRYLAEGHIVLARRNLRVVPARVTLDAPAQVSAGGEPIAVKWTGPRGRGAWITLVKPGAAEEEYGSYGNTSEATGPIELTVPEEPGDYEIRFVIGDKKVIARRPVRVTK